MSAVTVIPIERLATLSSRSSPTVSANYAGVMAFIAVATEGSFARAADRLGVGRSAVSRSVQKLEAQLGARLFSRTTRATSLTREGERFFENCRPGVERILQALDDMRDLQIGPPRGELKIRAMYGFGRRIVAPLLLDFRERFPGIAIELTLDDRAVDLVEERVDVAFLDGRLEDSQVIAKQLAILRTRVCAAPDYVRRHGLPASVGALSQHACVHRRLPNGRLRRWDFMLDGRARSVVPHGDLVLNDDELMLQAALDGRGLVQLPAFQVGEALRSGALVSCLDAFAPDAGGHYLCYLSRQQPQRVRVFVDFMTARIRAMDFDGTRTLER